MSFISDYKFNTGSRIGQDGVNLSTKNIENSKYSSYNTASFFGDKITDSQINFISNQPTMNIYGATLGAGIGGSLIDDDSRIVIKSTQERSTEKLQLFSRPFVTVPYLGRGSVDTGLESQLQQGEPIHDKKSVSTIMDKSFIDYTQFPLDDEMQNRIKDDKHVVEESALKGWIRGGMATRDINS
jgi:hypothetical protein